MLSATRLLQRALQPGWAQPLPPDGECPLEVRADGGTGLPFLADAVAYEACQSLIAASTPEGDVVVCGAPGVEISLRAKSAAPTTLLAFNPALSALVRVGRDGGVDAWALGNELGGGGAGRASRGAPTFPRSSLPPRSATDACMAATAIPGTRTLLVGHADGGAGVVLLDLEDEAIPAPGVGGGGAGFGGSGGLGGSSAFPAYVGEGDETPPPVEVPQNRLSIRLTSMEYEIPGTSLLAGGRVLSSLAATTRDGVRPVALAAHAGGGAKVWDLTVEALVAAEPRETEATDEGGERSAAGDGEAAATVAAPHRPPATAVCWLGRDAASFAVGRPCGEIDVFAVPAWAWEQAAERGRRAKLGALAPGAAVAHDRQPPGGDALPPPPAPLLIRTVRIAAAVDRPGPILRLWSLRGGRALAALGERGEGQPTQATIVESGPWGWDGGRSASGRLDVDGAGEPVSPLASPRTLAGPGSPAPGSAVSSPPTSPVSPRPGSPFISRASSAASAGARPISPSIRARSNGSLTRPSSASRTPSGSLPQPPLPPPRALPWMGRIVGATSASGGWEEPAEAPGVALASPPAPPTSRAFDLVTLSEDGTLLAVPAGDAAASAGVTLGALEAQDASPATALLAFAAAGPAAPDRGRLPDSRSGPLAAPGPPSREDSGTPSAAPDLVSRTPSAPSVESSSRSDWASLPACERDDGGLAPLELGALRAASVAAPPPPTRWPLTGGVPAEPGGDGGAVPSTVVASGHADGSVRLWDSSAAVPRLLLVALASDGPRAPSGGGREAGGFPPDLPPLTKGFRARPRPLGAVSALAAAPASGLLAVGHDCGEVRVWALRPSPEVGAGAGATRAPLRRALLVHGPGGTPGGAGTPPSAGTPKTASSTPKHDVLPDHTEAATPAATSAWAGEADLDASAGPVAATAAIPAGGRPGLVLVLAYRHSSPVTSLALCASPAALVVGDARGGGAIVDLAGARVAAALPEPPAGAARKPAPSAAPNAPADGAGVALAACLFVPATARADPAGAPEPPSGGGDAGDEAPPSAGTGGDSEGAAGGSEDRGDQSGPAAAADPALAISDASAPAALLVSQDGQIRAFSIPNGRPLGPGIPRPRSVAPVLALAALDARGRATEDAAGPRGFLPWARVRDHSGGDVELTAGRGVAPLGRATSSGSKRAGPPHPPGAAAAAAATAAAVAPRPGLFVRTRSETAERSPGGSPRWGRGGEAAGGASESDGSGDSDDSDELDAALEAAAGPKGRGKGRRARDRAAAGALNVLLLPFGGKRGGGGGGGDRGGSGSGQARPAGAPPRLPAATPRSAIASPRDASAFALSPRVSSYAGPLTTALRSVERGSGEDGGSARALGARGGSGGLPGPPGADSDLYAPSSPSPISVSQRPSGEGPPDATGGAFSSRPASGAPLSHAPSAGPPAPALPPPVAYLAVASANGVRLYSAAALASGERRALRRAAFGERATAACVVLRATAGTGAAEGGGRDLPSAAEGAAAGPEGAPPAPGPPRTPGPPPFAVRVLSLHADGRLGVTGLPSTIRLPLDAAPEAAGPVGLAPPPPPRFLPPGDAKLVSSPWEGCAFALLAGSQVRRLSVFANLPSPRGPRRVMAAARSEGPRPDAGASGLPGEGGDGAPLAAVGPRRPSSSSLSDDPLARSGAPPRRTATAGSELSEMGDDAGTEAPAAARDRATFSSAAAAASAGAGAGVAVFRGVGALLGSALQTAGGLAAGVGDAVGGVVGWEGDGGDERDAGADRLVSPPAAGQAPVTLQGRPQLQELPPPTSRAELLGGASAEARRRADVLRRARAAKLGGPAGAPAPAPGAPPSRRTASDIRREYRPDSLRSELEGARAQLGERGEKLSALQRNTEAMEDEAKDFATVAKELHERYANKRWWRG